MPLSPEDIEKQRRADYREVFGSSAGRRVLADLEAKFLFQDARPYVQAGNTEGVVWMSAQAAVMMSIKRWSVPLTEEPPAQKFEAPITQGDVYA